MRTLIRLLTVIVVFFQASVGTASDWRVEWERVLEAARKEGKVVASVPPSAELRRGIEQGFGKRFGTPIELVPSRGAVGVRRILEESRAGIPYFDLHVGGSESIVTGLLAERVLEPLEPWLILPEIKDPEQWWGGHIWIDNARRYAYAFQAYQTENLWYHTGSVREEEVRSFDDFLDPQWKGKIAFSDPRVPGSGASLWSYLLEIKGEEFLRRLVLQNMLLSRDLRLLAENLANGKVRLTLGVTYSSFLPFVKAGLPVKPLPTPREGVYTTGGDGHLTILRNPPHPNATRVFVNWLLGKEGQEIFSRAMGQGTRRLDVETRWLKEFGVLAAKDGLTLDNYYRRENQSENKVYKVRIPGAALARKLLD